MNTFELIVYLDSIFLKVFILNIYILKNRENKNILQNFLVFIYIQF